jgi:hypothetical protein
VERSTEENRISADGEEDKERSHHRPPSPYDYKPFSGSPFPLVGTILTPNSSTRYDCHQNRCDSYSRKNDIVDQPSMRLKNNNAI